MTNIYQISSKLPDGRIFVVGGENFEEFKTNLQELLGDEGSESVLSTMASSVEGYNDHAQAIATVTNNIASTPMDAYTNERVLTAPDGKSCKHGEMSRRTGNGAKGQWKAFMCPAPKGAPDQCEPVWVRRNDPEWASF
jgi:hypothetical protein